tara:strand:+ start:329 stop:769 length:441 start_codon:yes stop_codon:yes gene_type:complete
MTTAKRRGRPKGSKNKIKVKSIEVTVEEPVEPVVKKRGRPSGSRNKSNKGIPMQEFPGFEERKIVWEHLSTGYSNHINLKNNLELHKEDIPIFASDYKKKYKTNPRYVVINARNQHLIPYIQKEFPDIGVGYMGGVALWELRFCAG